MRFCEVGRNRKGMEKKLEMVFEPSIGEGEVEEAARAYSVWALGDWGGNGGVGARMGPCVRCGGNYSITSNHLGSERCYARTVRNREKAMGNRALDETSFPGGRVLEYFRSAGMEAHEEWGGETPKGEAKLVWFGAGWMVGAVDGILRSGGDGDGNHDFYEEVEYLKARMGIDNSKWEPLDRAHSTLMRSLVADLDYDMAVRVLGEVVGWLAKDGAPTSVRVMGESLVYGGVEELAISGIRGKLYFRAFEFGRANGLSLYFTKRFNKLLQQYLTMCATSTGTGDILLGRG